MFAAIPCDPLHELHRNSPDDRPLVRLAQRPELQHNSEPMGGLLYDPEWNNGMSFFYSLEGKECRSVQLEVGILRPNWLEGAEYLGQRHVNGFVWKEAHVMTFEVGALLEDENWQAPVYCFSKRQNSEEVKQEQPNFIKGAFKKRLIDGALSRLYDSMRDSNVIVLIMLLHFYGE
ncbi:hypothetical protein Patl1_26052 [Pistacia atlantica]|uniref:Uncharacterized protein n=1 Tax=Pistacia atlantica TaxID=434234 RepID=A0ACC1B4A9_9ROSI|nr:hypothetical protein Patl1_26052 [Pistacia atlantica]